MIAFESRVCRKALFICTSFFFVCYKQNFVSRNATRTIIDAPCARRSPQNWLCRHFFCRHSPPDKRSSISERRQLINSRQSARAPQFASSCDRAAASFRVVACLVACPFVYGPSERANRRRVLSPSFHVHELGWLQPQRSVAPNFFVCSCGASLATSLHFAFVGTQTILCVCSLAWAAAAVTRSVLSL